MPFLYVLEIINDDWVEIIVDINHKVFSEEPFIMSIKQIFTQDYFIFCLTHLNNRICQLIALFK